MAKKTPPLHIDEGRNQVYIDGKEIRMPRKEYLLLVALAKSGKTLSRDTLLNEVWGIGPDQPVDTRTVDQHFARLRRRVRKVPFITTVTGFGYRLDVRPFFGPVTVIFP